MQIEQTDNELVQKVKEFKCNESLKELINRHGNLFFNIYSKYSTYLANSGVSFDSPQTEKDYVIYKAAISYKPQKKMKFSTWVGNMTRYHCLHELQTSPEYIPLEPEAIYSIMEDEQKTASYVPEMINVNDVFSHLKYLKDERVLEVFLLRYMDGQPQTWEKISKQMGISRQTALNIHNQGIDYLKNKFKNIDSLQHAGISNYNLTEA